MEFSEAVTGSVIVVTIQVLPCTPLLVITPIIFRSRYEQKIRIRPITIS